MEIAKERLIELLRGALQISEKNQGRVIFAVDGRCASGKTTLAKELSLVLQSPASAVFSIDDFFLPFSSRPENWREIPAGNIDLERFEREVLFSVSVGAEVVTYEEFDCKTGSFTERKKEISGSLVIIEGAYSMHPSFSKFYDLSLFLTTDRDTQIERIKKRGGETCLKMFLNTWIPMEERYFKFCRVEERCDFVMKN